MNSSIQEPPLDIQCSEQVFDLAFHPCMNVIASGHIDGSVEIWQYSHDQIEGSNKRIMHFPQAFASSCRGLRFTDDGQTLLAISSDRTYTGFDATGNTLFKIENAHDSSINKMEMIDGVHICATGDDDGVIKIWDNRTGPNATMTLNDQSDFVASMNYNADKKILLSISGDSTLCAYDIRKPKRSAKSEEQETEMTSVEWMRGGTKAVAGTQDGTLLIFSSKSWGDCSDRFPRIGDSVECMLKIDDNRLITGSNDGKLRAVNILPNKFISVIGERPDMSIEGIRGSRWGCETLFATHSVDEVIQFWDWNGFDAAGSGDDVVSDDDQEFEDDDSDSDGEDERDATVFNFASSSGGNVMSNGDDNDGDDDDAGMEEEGSDIGHDNNTQGQRSGRQRPAPGNSRKVTSSSSFFADL
jgi:WD repeat-containing protein 55